MGTRLTSVVFDGLDWQGLARFWAEALRWDLVEEDLVHQEAAVGPPGGGPIELVFVPTEHVKATKNRLHLDLAPERDQTETVERLLTLGASRADIGQRDVEWVVMADPEGNEFCVMPTPSATTSLLAICLDAADPVVQGPFWVEASGWTIEAQSDRYVALVPPGAEGPRLVMGPEVAPKDGKNRVHLDVAPFTGDDQAAEVERLVRAGARHVDIGQGDVSWVVLADPEGNEFCLLTPR